MRTLLAITATMFVLPALSAGPPAVPIPPAPPAPANGRAEPSLCFEVRAVKGPVGFCEQVGAKPTGDAPLTADQLLRVLEAAQARRDINVTQYPKVTTDDGQTATVGCTDPQYFVTALEVVKVKGQTVFVPKNTVVDLSDTFALTGHVLRDGRRVSLRANAVRTALAGPVELVPVVTQMTPIFEGGSVGAPIPFTQYLQVPDVKTEKVEKTAIVATDETIVLGVWKGTEEPKSDRPLEGKGVLKKEKAAEYEVVVFVTVRVLPGGAPDVPARAVPRAPETAVAPLPRERPALVTKAFEVCDLVTHTDMSPLTYQANVEKLLDLVTGMVRPDSWGDRGRNAEFFPIGAALVVNNAPEVIAEVADLLEALRRLRSDKPAATVAELHAILLRPAAPPAAEPKVLPLPLRKEPGAGSASARAMDTHKLRNIAAADAAHALNAFVTGQNLAARIVAEPVSNTVLVAAEPAVHQRLCQILAEMDQELPQIVARVTVLQVPRGFIDRTGLNVGGAAGAMSCTLTPRETTLVNELVRIGKERGECDVVSRPEVLVGDRQTGHLWAGQPYPVVTGFDIKTAGGVTTLEPKNETVDLGVTFDLAPRIAPDGKSVRLDTNFQFKQVNNEVKPPLMVTTTGAAFPVTHMVAVPTFTTSTVRETAEIPFGHTLVLVARSSAPAGPDAKFETLVFVTPELVKSQEPVRPAGGFVK